MPCAQEIKTFWAVPQLGSYKSLDIDVVPYGRDSSMGLWEMPFEPSTNLKGGIVCFPLAVFD